MTVIRSWDESITSSETTDFVRGLALSLAGKITCSTTREMLSEKLSSDPLDLHWLCETEVPYASMSPYDSYLFGQVLAFFKKREDIDLGYDLEAVAYEKFLESERNCLITNATFRAWSEGRFQFRPSVERVLHTAQRKIAYILGEVPSFDLLRFRFGPGATTQVKKKNASARVKLGETLACSEDLVKVLPEILAEVPQWCGLEFDHAANEVSVPVEIHHGLLNFVPKNAKTHRSIVVEPSLNSFVQLGVGDHIARALRMRGKTDIKDQTRNQTLAQAGSIGSGVATLDLSSASDSIARELVAHLLPIDWFLLLDSIRTGSVEYKGTTMKLQKFSSMGNGFTFPLETLIFRALAESCVDERQHDLVSVYGDDIIVPESSVDLVREVLSACGFLLNSSKSFWSGPFRESCGKDYHSGMLIRPFFLKERLSGETVFIAHNFFVRCGDFETAAAFLTLLDPSICIWGPDGYGDGHLISDQGLVHYNERFCDKRSHQYSGYIFDTFTWVGRKSYRPTPGDYVYPSYAIYLREGFKRPLSETDLRLAKCLSSFGRQRFLSLYGQEVLDELLSELHSLGNDSTPFNKKDDSWCVTLPGTRGYKRISIYTLCG